MQIMAQDGEGGVTRIVALGPGGVGKSCLTLRLVMNNFAANYDPTIEDSYRTMVTIDGQLERLEILDTAGQEEYVSMRDQWIRDHRAFFCVFAINNKSTFDEMQPLKDEIDMAMEAKDDSDRAHALILVGNKCDLEDSRQVEVAEAQALATKWGCKYIETSAKDGIRCKEPFFQLVKDLREAVGEEEGSKKGGKRKKFCVIL